MVARPEGIQNLCLDKGYDNPTGHGTVAAFQYCPHIRRIGEEKLDQSGGKTFPPGGGWWNAPWAGCPSAGRYWCATTRSPPTTWACFNWLVPSSGTAVNAASLFEIVT